MKHKNYKYHSPNEHISKIKYSCLLRKKAPIYRSAEQQDFINDKCVNTERSSYMHNKRLWPALFAGGLAYAVMLSGCSSAASSNKITISESTVSGTVSSIDGDTIILTASSQMGGNMMGGSAPMGSAPEGNAEGGSGAEGGAPDSNTQEDGAADTNSTDASSADANSSDTNSADNQTPPQKPDGEDNNASAPNGASGEGNSNDQTPPEKPDGDSSGDAAANEAGGDGQTNENSQLGENDQPDSNGQGAQGGGSDDSMKFEIVLNDTSVLKDADDNSIEISEIQEGDTLTVTIDKDGNITEVVLEDENSSQPGSGGSNTTVSYSAEKEFTEDSEVSDETYESTGKDENTILISNGATVSLDNVTATRDSSESTGGDNSSFYGVGADVLATDGTAYVKGGSFTTDANGGAGLFAYGNGVIYAADSTINTSADTSGGIHAAGGGTLYAWNLNVTTAGNSSAAIRSDRGGGTIVADGGTYTSTGTGSPAVYTTADISVNDATLTAENSEAICLEGKNTLRLYNCDLSGNMADDEQNDCTWNVILYQSMSGDSEEGEGSFQMTGGSLTANNGGQFYTTNTESTFYLSGVDIKNASDSEFFLRCTGNNNQRGWGSSGSNGADCNFTASDQVMEGDVIYDSISNLDFYMTNGSSLTGAFIDDESYAGNGGTGKANLYIDADSTWIVTGDSTLTELQSEGTICDSDGKTVTIKGTDGTVYVEGDSEYTVTVEKYSSTADVSGAATADEFSAHAVDKPEQLG